MDGNKAPTQLDIFEALYVDIPLRDQRDAMERPFFSLSKRTRTAPIEYDRDGIFVRVTTGDFGIATIWDADVLIWCATQLTEALNRGETPARQIHFHPHNLLKAIRRGVSGAEYARLKAALRRLATTYVQTNIRAGTRAKIAEFHWLEGWQALEENGKPTGMSITLSEWAYQGIVRGGGVLSIHPHYFSLTGGIERWLYRVARKHAGHQSQGWSLSMALLYEKSGSSAALKDFAVDVRKVVRANTLPEYSLMVTRNRKGEELISMVPRVLVGSI